MNKIRQWWVAGAAVTVLVVVIGAGAVMAQTPSATPGTPSASGTPAAGQFKSNEDPAHEKNESADREAAEDSGQFHGGRHGGKSNEDPAHEKNESADREAQEDAAQASPSPSTN